MKNYLFLLFALFTFNLSAENSAWIAWDSAEGLNRMESARSKANFWKLLRYYESQSRPTYCSLASSVIALNALSIEAPKSKFLGKYRMFTQEEFFTEKLSSIIDPALVSNRGMSLTELTEVLSAFPISVSMHAAKDMAEDQIRSLLISALEDPHQCILALFHRKVLNQEGGGHWSPIAAYDASSDSFLILDVARFKYPPHWVPAAKLIESMQTSNMYGDSRGFILLDSKNPLFFSTP